MNQDRIQYSGPRRDPRKAYDMMLDALDLLRERGPDAVEAVLDQLRAAVRCDPLLPNVLDGLRRVCMAYDRPEVMWEALREIRAIGVNTSEVLEESILLGILLERPQDTRRLLGEFRAQFPRKRKVGGCKISDVVHGLEMRLGPLPELHSRRSTARRSPPSQSRSSPTQRRSARSQSRSSPTQRRSSPPPESGAKVGATDHGRRSVRSSGATTRRKQVPGSAESRSGQGGPVSSPGGDRTSKRRGGPRGEAADRRALLTMPELPALSVDIRLEDAGPLEPATSSGGEQDDYEICLAAYRLGLVSNIDELLCLPHLRDVRQLRYQVETVRRVLRRFRGRALLCDEVGLGKTIEAGMVIKEYQMRGLLRSVLVLVPPTLIGQWREELAQKFDLQFQATTDPAYRKRPEQFWAETDWVLASTATAKSSRNQTRVTAREFDLIVVDEAHHLRNRSTKAWKLVNGLKSRFMLLLTATPLQNNLEELHNLITLLKPGQLRTRAAFQKEFVSAKDPTIPKNKDRLRELLSEVMIRNTRALAGIKLPPRHARTIVVAPTKQESALYDAVTALVRTEYRRIVKQDRNGSAEPSTRDTSGDIDRLTLRLLQSEAGSSPAAVLATVKKILGRTTERRATERRATEHRTTEHRAIEGGRGASGSASHSTTARNEALSTRLREIVETAESIREPSKLETLCELLKAGSGKTIVFASYRATVELLHRELSKENLRCVMFHGGLAAERKAEVIQEFQRDGGIRAMLTTDVGAEGHNLQFCHHLVNYDLPWNPMRLEQRIGRLHRIGQRDEVEILSLCARGSVEDHVLEILSKKINLFELVVGEVDMILGQVDDSRDFSEKVFEAWASADSDQAAEANFERLSRDLEEAKAGYDRVKRLDEELFGEDYETA